ncbi:MAG: DegT/DnrJ/EryC1/StrS family aminotransferase [Candidatus Poseidoniaceae archaeon]|jgi:perosamine synthetase|nr:DegT/DnrJ/EryC1/StrS family aminotransferase [Candidatus Poseidoniaceae archaeon]
MTRIPLARPYWDEECQEAAVNVLSSGRWVKGPQAQAFGEEFAKWCGAVAAVPCQSGSAALMVALRLLGIGPGDEVIVPGMTFIATATSVSLVGATPVFADIEEEYWCISPQDVEVKITSKTKAVIGVHIFGQPFSSKLREICDEKKIALIEDAAQAHGASLDGIKAGAIGDLACFSFFPSKNMAVGGEGGMVTTTRKDLADRLRRLVDHGRDDALESIELGTNLRMSEVNAAIGRIQLTKIDQWTSKRRSNSKFIEHETLTRPGSEHAWHQLCILSDDPNLLITKFDEAQIDARVHYPIPCNRHQVYSEHFQHKENLVVCDKIAHKLVAIPIHPSLTHDELSKIKATLHSSSLC